MLTILRICTPRIATLLLAPWLIACALTWLALRGHPTRGEEDVDTAMLWLQLPLTALTIGAVVATLEAWPGFGRDRRGRDLIDRLRLGAVDGCGLAGMVGCALAAILMVVTGLGFELLLGRDACRPIESLHRVHAEAGPRLGPGETLHFALPATVTVERIELRPRMPLAADGSFAPGTLRVLDQDGRAIGEDRLVEHHGQLISLRFEPRQLSALQVQHLEGAVPLWIPDDALRVSRISTAPAWLNTLLVSLSGVVSTILTMALLLLGRHRLSLGVAAAAAIGLPLLWNLSGLVPQSAAIAACARDRWCLDATVLERSFWSLSIAATAMLLAVVIRRPRDAR